MMRRLQTLLAGFLLVTALTLNAHAFTAVDDTAVVNPPQQSSGWCWFYYMGRWIQFPC